MPPIPKNQTWGRERDKDTCYITIKRQQSGGGPLAGGGVDCVVLMQPEVTRSVWLVDRSLDKNGMADEGHATVTLRASHRKGMQCRVRWCCSIHLQCNLLFFPSLVFILCPARVWLLISELDNGPMLETRVFFDNIYSQTVRGRHLLRVYRHQLIVGCPSVFRRTSKVN